MGEIYLKLKNISQFIRAYRGQEIIDACSEIDCSLKEIIECIKSAYNSYRKENSKI